MSEIYYAIKTKDGFDEVFKTKEEAKENLYRYCCRRKLVKVRITEVQ